MTFLYAFAHNIKLYALADKIRKYALAHNQIDLSNRGGRGPPHAPTKRSLTRVRCGAPACGHRFAMFNIDQCEGLPKTLAGVVAPLPDREIIPHAEALNDATGADFRIGGDRAYYAPSLDVVAVPLPQLYRVPIDFYRTAFHELGHYAARRFMPRGSPTTAQFRAFAARHAA